MSLYIIIAVLFAVWLREYVTHLLESKHWRAERRELYNRIQAGTIRDYAFIKPALETQPKQKAKAPIPDIEPRTEDEYMSTEPHVDIVAAQEAASRLMN